MVSMVINTMPNQYGNPASISMWISSMVFFNGFSYGGQSESTIDFLIIYPCMDLYGLPTHYGIPA